MKFNIEEYLSHVFIFESLTENERSDIASKCSVKRYKKNATLFSRGDKADAFYLIADGKVSVFRVSAGGEEQVIHIHSNHEIVAEAAIFDQTNYPASCKTLKESLIVKVTKESFLNLIIKRPETSLKILSSYSKRLREFVSMVEYLSLDDVKLRILKYLDKHKIKEGDNFVIRLGITKKDLSKLIGTVPETLSRNIKVLKGDGIIIESGGVFTITDIKQFNHMVNS